MEPTESAFIIIFIALNLAVGFGFAVPIARLLGEVTGEPKKFFYYFAMFIGIYFIESMAFAAGMATQVFSIGLALVWGVVFGFWLRRRAPSLKVLRTSFFLSLYGSFPTASFGGLILVGWLVKGNSVLSVEEGARLGIPYFVPWPLCTVLGFCSALVIGTVLLKTLITTSEVSLLIHLGEKPETL